MTPPLIRAILAALLVAAPACAVAQTGSGEAMSSHVVPGQAEPGVEAKRRREPSARSLAARERQRRCGAEWRALGRPEKEAQGPRWPQYYSKCVRRLKEQRA